MLSLCAGVLKIFQAGAKWLVCLVRCRIKNREDGEEWIQNFGILDVCACVVFLPFSAHGESLRVVTKVAMVMMLVAFSKGVEDSRTVRSLCAH